MQHNGMFPNVFKGREPRDNGENQGGQQRTIVKHPGGTGIVFEFGQKVEDMRGILGPELSYQSH